MTRRRKADPDVKPGKKSWISGTKLRFLKSHNPAWLTSSARSPDAAGLFYSHITKLWIKKYGWHFNHEHDLEVDTPDPTSESLLEPEESVGDEEAAKREAYHTNMRVRIRSYYYRANKNVSAVDTAKEITEILDNAADVAPKPPRKLQILHYYSHLYYVDRIKPTVDAEWAKKKALSSSDSEQETAKFVDFQNKVTQRFWENETQAFRENIKTKLEEEHAARRKAFEEHIQRVTQQNPHSAEAYHSRLSTAGATLSNLCEALGKQYGMNVSILLCGPIGAREGRIEMRSVHSGVTSDLDPRKWPQAFPEAFREVQENMVAFGKLCFTPQQCKARSLGQADQDGNLPDAAALSNGPEGFGLYALDEDAKLSEGSTPPPTATLLTPTSVANNDNLPHPNDVTTNAGVVDFDPFGEFDDSVGIEPPGGLDSINTNFFGDPQNLSLLTQHLQDDNRAGTWDAFKELMDEQGVIPNVSGVNPPLSDDNHPHPYPQANTTNSQFNFPDGMIFPGRALGDLSAAANGDHTSPHPNSPTRLGRPLTDVTMAVDAESNRAGADVVSSASSKDDMASAGVPAPNASVQADAHTDPRNDVTQVDISTEFGDCPEPLRGLYAPLFDVAHELGPEFRACVGSLFKLERAAGWSIKDTRLPGAGRPSEYKDWMRYARPPDFSKVQTDFGERLWLWWTSMQPRERMDENMCLMRTGARKLDWGGMAAPGKSGIFLVVLGLYWWARHGGGCIENRWGEALVDVTWVCEHIVKYGGLPMSDVVVPEDTRAKSTAARKPAVKRKADDKATAGGIPAPANKRSRSRRAQH